MRRVCKHEETMIVFSHCFTFGLLFKVVFIFQAIFLTCSVIHNNVFAFQRSDTRWFTSFLSYIFYSSLPSFDKDTKETVDKDIESARKWIKEYLWHLQPARNTFLKLCDKTYISVYNEIIFFVSWNFANLYCFLNKQFFNVNSRSP